MPKEHVWKERTAEGMRREVRAVRHAGRWRLQSRVEPLREWTYHDAPALADLQELHALLKRKYSRKRASWDEVCEVDQLIKSHREAS
ncbi:MAG: hypothetical protein SNJ52_04500 [Verrucomicrobiia bacterium]